MSVKTSTLAAFLTDVRVSEDHKTVKITHTMQDDDKAKKGVTQYAFVHTLDIVAADRLAEALTNAVRLMHEAHAAKLPMRKYEPISGSNA